MIAGQTLTPRQMRIGLDLFAAAVIVSVAFALAGLTWRLLGHAGAGAVTPLAAGAPSAGSDDVAAAAALAPFGRSGTSEEMAPTTLPLELKGIVAAQPADLSTAFIVVSGQPMASFRVGQSVGAATIQGIMRDRVILSNAGRIEYLAFPAPVALPSPAAISQPTSAAPVAAAPNPDATDIGAMLQRFDATPADGGYRLGANAPPGLQSGDVLLSINGTPLSDPSSTEAAYRNAVGSGNATLILLRNGQRLTLTVPIR